ncbi:isochorismatase family cysteine hydrolase [Desulfobotulus sp.]|jgi:nicotinamidase-related amidase|uniref:cysteine hydrolase family protein n=1 Tax=Desulfobotulus sp. TaxID=1940337 RepID=UPI002A35D46C|nr:isochorismatase family cysteine hydrolase [Desulfobotulus sp.]MDY0162073.1 isochorismatase family cysteine hydrolase [Desulfobotulus sp.]
MKEERLALVIIDMQKDFVLPEAPLRIAGAAGTLPAIRRLLDAFRAEKRPVIHVIREHRTDGVDVEAFRMELFTRQGGFAVPGTRGVEIVDELKPLEGEYVLVKRRFSAFMQTELDFMLRRLGVTRLVVCGTQYPVCIRTTIFDALALGYDVTSVVDATSAQTEEVAASNIRDIAAMGVTCQSVADFLAERGKSGG